MKTYFFASFPPVSLIKAKKMLKKLKNVLIYSENTSQLDTPPFNFFDFTCPEKNTCFGQVFVNTTKSLFFTPKNYPVL